MGTYYRNGANYCKVCGRDADGMATVRVVTKLRSVYQIKVPADRLASWERLKATAVPSGVRRWL